MYCPRCGQERISEQTSFCSKCGFLLTAAAELLANDGAGLVQAEPGFDSPRTRGIKQGIFMLLAIIVIAPILGMLSVFLLRIPPWPMGIAVFLLGGGGILRMAYALMFESKVPATSSEGAFPMPSFLRQGGKGAETPESGRQLTGGDADFIPPAKGRRGNWLDTNDLQPHSVIDNTTKLLEKEPDK